MIEPVRLKRWQEIHERQTPYFDKLYGESSLDVNQVIPPDETLNRKGDREQYFRAGQSALRMMFTCMQMAGKPFDSVSTAMDFACAHGNQTRQMIAAFPQAKIYACDIRPGGVEFCRDTLGAEAVFSKNDVEDIELDEKMDLIWSGSFFTHLNEEDWDAYLGFLASRLKDNGLLIFTVAGEYVVNLLRNGESHGTLSAEGVTEVIRGYENDGFGFAPNTVSHREKTVWGRTMVKPSWVIDKLETRSELEFIAYIRRGWVLRQDVVACMKTENKQKSKYFTETTYGSRQ